jgi:thiamine biosynthesis lipoprotein ApbE
MNRPADMRAREPWVATPVIRMQRPAAGKVVQVTTAGAEPEVAERATAALADLLHRWDLTDERSILGRLLRSHEALEVDDDTLLLLALTTAGTLDLPAGVARLAPGQSPPPLASIRALALDMTRQDLQDETIAGFCVAIDNDIAVAGTSPSGHGWAVELAALSNGRRPDVVRVSTGACVTVQGDPAGEVTAVSVHSKDAWHAAALALATVELTGADALQRLTDDGVTARLYTRGGAVDVGNWTVAGPAASARSERTSILPAEFLSGR